MTDHTPVALVPFAVIATSSEQIVRLVSMSEEKAAVLFTGGRRIAR